MKARMFVDSIYIGDLDLPIESLSWEDTVMEHVRSIRRGSVHLNSRSLREIFELFKGADVKLEVQFETQITHEYRATKFMATMTLRTTIMNQNRNDFDLAYIMEAVRLDII